MFYKLYNDAREIGGVKIAVIGPGTAEKVREQHLSFEKLIELGMFICGSPATVAERLERHHREMGIGRLVTMLQFGTLPRELTEKNMRLFAGEVMPKLRPLGERA